MPLKSPSNGAPPGLITVQKPTSLFLINSNKPKKDGGGAGTTINNLASERTPLISIDVCSDEELRQSRLNNAIDNFNGEEVIVNYPGTKRHSTGDASSGLPFSSALLGQGGSPNKTSAAAAAAASGGQTRTSTVSLYDPSGSGIIRKGRRGSNTAVTDF